MFVSQVKISLYLNPRFNTSLHTHTHTIDSDTSGINSLQKKKKKNYAKWKKLLEVMIYNIICFWFSQDQPFNRKKTGWPSKLPRDAQGNNDRVYFTNLQTDGKKDVLIKLLSKKADPRGKRGKQQSRSKKQKSCNSHLVIFLL